MRWVHCVVSTVYFPFLQYLCFTWYQPDHYEVDRFVMSQWKRWLLLGTFMISLYIIFITIVCDCKLQTCKPLYFTSVLESKSCHDFMKTDHPRYLLTNSNNEFPIICLFFEAFFIQLRRIIVVLTMFILLKEGFKPCNFVAKQHSDYSPD